MEDGGRDAKGRFITGNSGGGRSRGARSRLGERFSEDVLSAWEMHGPEAIQVVARDRPHEFLRICRFDNARRSSRRMSPSVSHRQRP